MTQAEMPLPVHFKKVKGTDQLDPGSQAAASLSQKASPVTPPRQGDFCHHIFQRRRTLDQLDPGGQPAIQLSQKPTPGLYPGAILECTVLRSTASGPAHPKKQLNLTLESSLQPCPAAGPNSKTPSQGIYPEAKPVPYPAPPQSKAQPVISPNIKAKLVAQPTRECTTQGVPPASANSGGLSLPQSTCLGQERGQVPRQ